MHPLLENRELVLVDQRGQRLSQHYDCYEARNAGHVDALYYPNGRAAPRSASSWPKSSTQ